ncbi:hypothetical protein [Kribbella pratensis]|uniref:hypothetical protein n=1 Tax=Kribbella pratensis TaxID=2512112 RepID=UPI0035C9A604
MRSRRRTPPSPSTEPTVTVEEVDATFAELAEMSGTGVQARRPAPVDGLFARTTAGEQRFLRLLVLEGRPQRA